MPKIKGMNRFLLILALALNLFSCDNSCLEADQFSIVPVSLDSNMRNMKVGVIGDYDHLSGGQRAEWYDTGLRTNGDKMVVYITGGWLFTSGSSSVSQEKVDQIPICNYCSKDISDANNQQNCICHTYANPTLQQQNQVPQAERDSANVLQTCATSQDYLNPDKCSCYDRGGNYVSRYGIYHQILNALEKYPHNENRQYKIGMKQTTCRITNGMGAYISLWGVNGAEVPTRAYHMFSQEASCPVVPINNECKINGKDATRYVFRSPDNLIFIKNDGLDNNLPTVSTSTQGFAYHGPNEVVKVMIYDGFYDDNVGKYNLYFSGGTGSQSDSFILEFLVSTVEDTILGIKGQDGVRSGGIIEFLYNAIVNNDQFKLILKLSLSMYIMFFGGAYLMGLVEITRKEISMIIMKLSLVILFTSSNSWEFYKGFVVNFFKDGMDELLAMIMLATDNATGDSSNLNFIAQGGRGIDGSNATRFSYPDLIMKKLLSESVIKKLLAIFGDGFKSAINGIIIFILTYGLIFYFLYVMLIIASTYLVTMIKMVFVLSLGPIFIIFALFSKTNDMFKSWVAFLGSRALEMALLFLILSPFLITIDRFFTDLFYYKVCGVQKGIPPVYLYVLQTIDLNRSLFEWIVKLLKIAGVIFIMHQVIGKVSEIAGYLISISGIPNQDTTTKAGYGSGGFALASGAVGAALGLGVSGLKGLGSFGVSGAGSAIGGATTVARATGIASAWNAIGKKIPFRGLRTRARDAVINGAINEAKANGKSMGLSGKELDQYVRDETMKTLAKRLAQEPTKMALYGVDSTSISKVLDQNLIRDGMKDFITKKAQELKEEGLIGKEFRQQLKKEAKEWARENLYDSAGEKKVDQYLKDSQIKSFLRSKAEYTSSEAANLFQDKDDKAKYLAHLQDLKYRKEKKWEMAKQNPLTKMVPYLLSTAKNEIMGNVKGNPNLARANFDRKAHLEANDREGWARYNPLAYLNFVDKKMRAKEFESTRQEHDRLLQKQLADDLANESTQENEFDENDTPTIRTKKQRRINHRDNRQTKLRNLSIAEVEENLAQQQKLNPGVSIDNIKTQMKSELVESMAKSDNKTLFEKAIQHDVLTGAKGKGSMEDAIASVLQGEVAKIEKNIDKLSIQELIATSDNLKNSELKKGLFATSLDQSLIPEILKKAEDKDSTQGSSLTPDNKGIWDKKSQNGLARELQNVINKDLSKIDEKLQESFEKKQKVYNEELGNLETTIDKMRVNREIVGKRDQALNDQAKSADDFIKFVVDKADGLAMDQSIKNGIKGELYKVSSSPDQQSGDQLPIFINNENYQKILSQFQNAPENIRQEIQSKYQEFLKKHQELSQAYQIPLTKNSLPQISQGVLIFEAGELAKASSAIINRSDEILANIDKFRQANNTSFTSEKWLENEQRFVGQLNQSYQLQGANLREQSFDLIDSLQKDKWRVDQINNQFTTYASQSAQESLGIDKTIVEGNKLKDKIDEKITELRDLRKEGSNQVINEKIGQIIGEIDTLKIGYLDDYRKSTKLFEVEHYLKESKKDATQLNQQYQDQANQYQKENLTTNSSNGAIVRALEEIKSLDSQNALAVISGFDYKYQRNFSNIDKDKVDTEMQKIKTAVDGDSTLKDISKNSAVDSQMLIANKDQIIAEIGDQNNRLSSVSSVINQALEDQPNSEIFKELKNSAQNIKYSQDQLMQKVQEIDPQNPNAIKADEISIQAKEVMKQQEEFVKKYEVASDIRADFVRAVDNVENLQALLGNQSISQDQNALDQLAQNPNLGNPAETQQFNEIKERVGIIANNFEMTFGKKIDEALLTGNIQNAFIAGGVPMLSDNFQNDQSSNLTQAQQTEFKSKQTLASLTAKMSKLEIKMKEFELSQGVTDHDYRRISQEINELKTKESSANRLLDQLNSRLES